MLLYLNNFKYNIGSLEFDFHKINKIEILLQPIQKNVVFVVNQPKKSARKATH